MVRMSGFHGDKAMAIAFTLIESEKLNSVDHQAWLAWVLERIADYKITKLDELVLQNYGPGASAGSSLPY